MVNNPYSIMDKKDSLRYFKCLNKNIGFKQQNTLLNYLLVFVFVIFNQKLNLRQNLFFVNKSALYMFVFDKIEEKNQSLDVTCIAHFVVLLHNRNKSTFKKREKMIIR